MRIYITVILLALYLPSISQEIKVFHPVITLRTNPSSFLETDAGAMLGIGYQFHPRWSVAIDPMLIFYTPYQVNNGHPDEKEPVRGYKVRGDLKYYFRDYVSGKRGSFIGLELHYKKITTKPWDTFGMSCVNGQCDFYERTQYHENKTEEGFAVKAGLIRRLWSPRWTIELYTGIGVKYKHTTETNLPAGGAATGDLTHDDFSLKKDGAYPMFPTGVKFVFRIF